MQQSVLHKALYAFIWGRSTLCNRLFDSMYSLGSCKRAWDGTHQVATDYVFFHSVNPKNIGGIFPKGGNTAQE